MQPELVLKVMSHSSVGLLLVALLFLLLVSLRREIDGGNPLRGMIQFGLFLMGIFTFIALISGYFQVRKLIVPQTNAQRLDTAARTDPHGEGLGD
jgi:Na+/melibiose symporter-like transporter